MTVLKRLMPPMTLSGARTAILGLLFFVTVCAAGPRGVPPSEGIVNFGKVNDGLYRGAQPDSVGLASLKRLGIKTIINLRTPNDIWKAEAAEANTHGIIYTNVPMKGFGRPAPEQVAKALAIIETLPAPVFVHCEHGCDRTGTIIACYRIRHDQWSSELALQEARKYGLSWLERAMRAFILDFAKASTRP